MQRWFQHCTHEERTTRLILCDVSHEGARGSEFPTPHYPPPLYWRAKKNNFFLLCVFFVSRLRTLLCVRVPGIYYYCLALKPWFDSRTHICRVCFGMHGQKKRSKPNKHFNNTYQYTINNGTNYTDYMHVLGSRLLGFTSVGPTLHIHSSRSPQLVSERRVRANRSLENDCAGWSVVTLRKMLDTKQAID